MAATGTRSGFDRGIRRILSLSPLAGFAAALAALLRVGLAPNPLGSRAAWVVALGVSLMAGVGIGLASSFVGRIEVMRGRRVAAWAATLVAGLAWAAYSATFWVTGSFASHWLHPWASAALVSTGLVVLHASKRGAKNSVQASTLVLFSALLLVQAVFLVHLWFAEGPWQNGARPPRPSLLWLAPLAALLGGLGRFAFAWLPQRIRIVESPLDAAALGAQGLAAAALLASGVPSASVVGLLRAVFTVSVLVGLKATTLNSAVARGWIMAEAALTVEGIATGTFVLLSSAMGA